MLPILAVVCAPGATVAGIDVDQNAGTVDWNMVRAAGKEFAFASIGDGLAPDAQFQTNWTGMQQAGVIRGAYFLFEPATDPDQQATLVVNAVGFLANGDLPVVVDVETTGGQPTNVLVANLTTFANHVAASTGRQPIVFTSHQFWDTNVVSSAFASDLLWVADHGVVCPNIPTEWSTWAFWQDSNTGTVAGVTGTVDTDTFNGSDLDLQQLANPFAPPDDFPVFSDDFFPGDDAGMTPGHKPLAGCCDAGGAPDVGSLSLLALLSLRLRRPRPRRS